MNQELFSSHEDPNTISIPPEMAFELLSDSDWDKYSELSNLVFSSFLKSDEAKVSVMPEAWVNTKGSTVFPANDEDAGSNELGVRPNESRVVNEMCRRYEKDIPVHSVISGLLTNPVIFSPVNKKQTVYYNNRRIMETPTLRISFTGPGLTQSELDLIMVLMTIIVNTGKPVVEVTAYELLKALGVSNPRSYSSRESLENKLVRLNSSALSVEYRCVDDKGHPIIDEHGKDVWNRYHGSFIYQWARINDKKNGRYRMKISVNPFIPLLLQAGQGVVLSDLKVRIGFQRDNMAKWLYTMAREMTYVDDDGNLKANPYYQELAIELLAQDLGIEQVEDLENFYVQNDNLVARLTIEDLIRLQYADLNIDKLGKVITDWRVKADVRRAVRKSIQKLSDVPEFTFEFCDDRDIIITRLRG